MLDLTGRTFGRWTVLSYYGVINEKRYWLCRCSCGTERRVSAAHLKRGKSTNCGCQRKETMARNHLTHGMSFTSTYRIWAAMITRCTNKNTHAFPRYGGRGISVCDRWQHDFQNFLDDMGLRPSTKYSIDRIDNDLGYEPSNCRWATATEQARNKRDTHWITAFNERKALIDWIEDPRCIVSRMTVERRIKKGMSPEQAMTALPHSGGRPSIKH